MAKATQPPNVHQRDFLQEMEEAKVVTSLPMQHYVNKMGSKQEFTAPELAGILGWATTDPVYALVDAGEIEYIDRGKTVKDGKTGKVLSHKRYCIFPRACVLALLKKLCNRI